MCAPTKERFREQNYRAGLETQRLKRCRWPIRNSYREFRLTKIERMLVAHTDKSSGPQICSLSNLREERS
jgi:sulfur relay (sulfurtransferase) DsrC/TusE family protein